MTNKQIHRLFYLAILASLAFALYLTWYNGNSPLHTRLQGAAYDLLLPDTTDQQDNRVVIVDIDESSLQKIGRWPWPRQTLAQLIDAIQQHSPAVIGLDILLPEPAQPNADQALKQRLAAHNLVSAVTFALPPDDSLHSQRPPPLWPRADQIVDLNASLQTTSTRKGHITPVYDGDGNIRRLYPIICLQQCYRTLSLTMLEQLLGLDTKFVPSASLFEPPRLCVGPYCQYLDQKGQVWVPYHHRQQFLHLSAADLLSGKRLPALKGAMVLVGTSAVGLGDNVSTPVSPDTPGVRIHATLLSGWFDSVTWAPLPYQQHWLTLLLILWTLLAMSWPHGVRLLHSLTLLSALALLALPPLLRQQGLWLNPLPGSFLVFSGLLAISAAYTSQALSQRRKLYKAFGSYVPPVVLKQLIRGGDKPKNLDAHRTRITVLFADIQGFTALSEKLTPEALVEMTNYLFTELTDEIHRHQGTLDKYMGDAVMAFWGAPLAQPNHAELALDCAIALERRLIKLHPWLRAKGLPEIKLSIGLETGEVTVGNLGSRQRRAYTVMGHTVNLAAHLQAMTGSLEQNVLLGPELCRQLPEERIQRLPQVEIKGVSGWQQIGTPVR